MEVFSESEACEYLAISTDRLDGLRGAGLVACQGPEGSQVYPKPGLVIVRQLLRLGHERGWEDATLACYADSVFATALGRPIRLPIMGGKQQTVETVVNWLETPYAAVIAQSFSHLEDTEGRLVYVLRSVAAVAVGRDQYWPNRASLEASSLYPIIGYFEAQGVPILGQSASIARDAMQNFGLMILAFASVAPPLSHEFYGMARYYYDKQQLRNSGYDVPPEERALIVREKKPAIDQLYVSKASEIHSPPEEWEYKAGVLRARRQTVAIEITVGEDKDQYIIDNIVDLVRPFLGAFGARIVRLLYETANDDPYWRHPVITVDTNDLLDRLRLRRDSRGFHRSNNRARLRNALNAAHNLEVVGEYTTWEAGKQVRKALRRTVLSVLEGTFDAEESRALKTEELFERGLPKSLTIRLHFYDSIRQPNGRLGSSYILIPRLAESVSLRSARHAATEEALKAYLLLRCRQTGSRELTITRAVALEKAGITNKNVTRATYTLTKALDRLVADGTLVGYASVPLHPHDSFTVTVAP